MFVAFRSLSYERDRTRMKQESSELTILKYQNCTLFVSKHQAYNLDTFYFRSFFFLFFSFFF
jgi:hypothetical protein